METRPSFWSLKAPFCWKIGGLSRLVCFCWCFILFSVIYFCDFSLSHTILVDYFVAF